MSYTATAKFIKTVIHALLILNLYFAEVYAFAVIIFTMLLVLFLEVSLHAAAQDKKMGCYIEMPFGGLLPYLGVGSMELQDQHINS